MLTVIGRLEQIRDEMDKGNESFASYLLTDRVFTCDIPRLREHLTKETIAWEAEFKEGIERSEKYVTGKTGPQEG